MMLHRSALNRVCLLVASVVFIGGPALAGDGAIQSLPLRPKPRTQVRVKIDTRWVNGNGYRPVRVTAQPVKAAPVDRNLRIELRPNVHSSNRTVVGTLTIPASSASPIETTILLPQIGTSNYTGIRMYLDGVEQNDLAGDLSSNNGGGRFSEVVPTVLFISSNAPTHDQRYLWRNNMVRYPDWGVMLREGAIDKFNKDLKRISMSVEREGELTQTLAKERLTLRRMTEQLDDRLEASRLSFTLPNIEEMGEILANDYYGFDGEVAPDFEQLQFVENTSNIELLPPAALPEQWLGFTCFQVIFISLADAQEMEASFPARWNAIVQWARSGRTLCIYDVGSKRGDVVKLLDMRASDWLEPQTEQFSREIQAQSYTKGYDPYGYGDTLMETAPMEEPSSPPKETLTPPANPPFVFRKLQLGYVVVWEGSPTEGPKEHRTWMFNAIEENRWVWTKQHGMSMVRENSGYWNLMIPGVGKAPVVTFIVCISLFVIVIGPINFFFVKKLKRPYLLLVTIPSAAFLVTFGLFAFALLTDGIGVRCRARSFTHIDQRTQTAASWSRQTYYAALSPSRLKYPEDAALYSVHLHPNSQYGGGSDSPSSLRWQEDQQEWRGLLRSRNPSQFLLTEVHKTERGIPVVAMRDESKPPQATNELEVEIQHLLLRDRNGALWFADDVPVDANIEFESITEAAWKSKVRELLAENRLRPLDGIDPNVIQRSNRWNYYYGDIDPGAPVPSDTDSILEQGIRSISAPSELMPRSYIAWIKHSTVQSPEVSLGVSKPRMVAGVHVITGEY